MPTEEHKLISDFLNPDVGNFRFHNVNAHVVPSQVVKGETWRKVKNVNKDRLSATSETAGRF